MLPTDRLGLFRVHVAPSAAVQHGERDALSAGCSIWDCGAASSTEVLLALHGTCQ